MSATASSNFVGFASYSSSSSYKARPVVTVRASLSGAITETKKKNKSLYQVLRVKETATIKEIKAAYRVLAKRYHPDVDRAGNNNGAEFMEIQGAYATLSDPEAKEMYDRTIQRRGGFSINAGLRVPRGRWETDQCW